MLRSVDPDRTGEFARAHDEGRQWACDILQMEAVQADILRSIASLPLVLGGVGLRSVERVPSAYWASWVDCIPTNDVRHLAVAESLARELVDHPHTPPTMQFGLWKASCGGKSWDLGKEGARVGDRDLLDLSGGRWQSHDECHGPPLFGRGALNFPPLRPSPPSPPLHPHPWGLRGRGGERGGLVLGGGEREGVGLRGEGVLFPGVGGEGEGLSGGGGR